MSKKYIDFGEDMPIAKASSDDSKLIHPKGWGINGYLFTKK